VPRGAKSRMRRTETPKSIWIKFCMVVDIPDVVTYTNLGDHRLRGFWVAGGQISPSPIDFHRCPYNTLALPCERVMHQYQVKKVKTAHSQSMMANYISDTHHKCTAKHRFQSNERHVLIKTSDVFQTSRPASSEYIHSLTSSMC